MDLITRAAHPGPADALPLTDLVISGALRRIQANADGSWTITPTAGHPLVLTTPADVLAYVDQAHGTGPAALAPARPLPAVDTDEPEPQSEPHGCGCVPTTRPAPAAHTADLLQARAISAALGDFGVGPSRRSAAWDETAQAAVVRIATTHGIYALRVPPVGQPFGVWRNGVRDGAVGARRVPANTDSYVATLYAAYLRERGVL